jgi:thymidine kinase
MGNNQSYNMSESIKYGSLHLIIGCMYAGKSTKLIEIYNDVLDNDKHATILTHSLENRYSINEISTHDQHKIPCVKYSSIELFIENEANIIETSDVILVDEAQFFEDLLSILKLVEKYNKTVFVFGLDGDFKRNKFGKILDLIPLCDSIEKITATCKCDNVAIFSNRTIHNETQILVGSTDAYEPLCRKCYIENNIF